MKTKFTILLTTVVAVTVCFVAPSTAQQLIYQEGFNTDGEAANPKRYTTIGRDVYTVDRIKAEVDPATQQQGPVYWAHNVDVPNSFVGVPGPTPARRAMLAWDSTITADAVSPQMQSVLTATFKWLLNINQRSALNSSCWRSHFGFMSRVSSVMIRFSASARLRASVISARRSYLRLRCCSAR